MTVQATQGCLYKSHELVKGHLYGPVGPTVFPQAHISPSPLNCLPLPLLRTSNSLLTL